MSFKKVYPGNQRVLFDGGLNNKYSKEILPDNESPDCANVIFENGNVSTREGSTLLNTSAVGSFSCNGLYTRHANDGTSTMVAFFGSDMQYLSGTTFVTIPSSLSMFSSSERVDCAEYEGYLFCGNGTVNYKYNGAEFTQHGVIAPTATATAGTAPTGTNLTGDYRYAVTYVNSNLVESDMSPVIGTFTAASEDIRLTSIPTAPISYGVNQRYLYRTADGGSVYKRLATLADNSTTTYDDAIADGSLGVPAPSDNGVPPNYDTIIYHQNRMFMNDTSEPNLVWYSELANPYTVGATSFLRIGDDSGDIVRGFQVFDNSLVIFADNSQWIIYMASTSPSDWQVIRVRSSYGCKSPYGSVVYNNKVLFPAMQNDKFVGFAAISGDSTDPSATLLTVSAAGSDLKSDRIEPDMFLIQEAHVKNIAGTIYKNKAYLAVTYGDGNTTNNRIYVFDFSISNLSKKQEASWVPWTGLSPNDFTIYDGNLYYATSTASGQVFKLNDGTYNDNGSAIDSYYWTKEFSGFKGEEHLYKNFRKAHVLHENVGTYFMNMRYRADSDAGEGNSTAIDLDTGTTTWGAMVWGNNVWGGGRNDDEVRITLGNTKGKRIQFQFNNQNAADQKFVVKGLRFEYDIRGVR